jgi:hypothetical protein
MASGIDREMCRHSMNDIDSTGSNTQGAAIPLFVLLPASSNGWNPKRGTKYTGSMIRGSQAAIIAYNDRERVVV